MSISFITYHYIRNSQNSTFKPYARTVEEFEMQVEYLYNNFEIIDPNDIDKVGACLRSSKNQGIIFTFDDGYKDHIIASQILRSYEAKGLFFIPGKVIEGEELEVNRIHLLTYSGLSSEQLLEKLEKIIRKEKMRIRTQKRLTQEYATIESYIQELLNDNGFDHGYILAIKRLLQRDIVDTKDRAYAVKELLNELGDDLDLNELGTLYMDNTDISKLSNDGHAIGPHGHNHVWLGTQNQKVQSQDIKLSIKALYHVIQKKDIRDWYSYPYGSFNEETIRLMQENKINFSLTTDWGEAYMDQGRYQLKRWDTNDWWNSDENKPKSPNY